MKKSTPEKISTEKRAGRPQKQAVTGTMSSAGLSKEKKAPARKPRKKKVDTGWESGY